MLAASPHCFAMRKATDVLNKIFKNHPRDFNVKLWNGHIIEWCERPKFTLVFREEGSFRKLLLKADVFTAGRAYVEGKMDIEGDLFEAIKLGDYLSQLRLRGRDKLKILWELWMM